VGLSPVDEMSISNIASREAIFDTFTWSEADAYEHVIRRVNVTPALFQKDTSEIENRGALTPVMFASLPFAYWRGTLIFRFRVMCSALHRGRIRISYDPAGTASLGAYNEVYSRIIDIQTNKDIEIPVEWHATNPWLRCHKPNFDNASDIPYGTSISVDPEKENGQLTISVINQLTSPDNTLGNVVTIIGSVRAGDDIEFAGPASYCDKYSWQPFDVGIQPQSAFEEQEDATLTPDGSKPLEPIGNVHVPYDSHLNKVFFGEVMPSLRTYLRRYHAVPSVANATKILNRTTVAHNQLYPIEYVMSAYVGWRGSFRYKVIAGGADTRLALGFAGLDNSNGQIDSGNTGIFYNRGSAEIEVPYYSIKRFEHCRTHPALVADTNYRGDFSANSQGCRYTGGEGVYVFQAIGEDFTCFFFIGPPLYYSV
jgi:hypothetical protein